MSIQLYQQNTQIIQHGITEKSRMYLGESLAKNTRIAYQRDFNVFLAWCQIHNKQPLPASPETICDFISDQASGKYSVYDAGTLTDGEKIKPTTISRRIAAIAYAHRANAFPQSPTDSNIVKTVMKGIRRQERYRVKRCKPVTPKMLSSVVNSMETETLTGLRDKAMLLFGFACAMRSSEVVNLRVEDITKTEEGILVYFPFSKRDQEGLGATVAVKPGSFICPIKAIDEWLKASNIKSGYIFRRIFKNGQVDKVNRSLSTRTVSLMLKRRVGVVGFESPGYSAHSLRRGFITSSALNRANIFKIMSVSRHKSIETVKTYVEDIEKFHDHAAEGLM